MRDMMKAVKLSKRARLMTKGIPKGTLASLGKAAALLFQYELISSSRFLAIQRLVERAGRKF